MDATKEKLLKTIKNIKNFTIDDLVIITEMDEEFIKDSLNKFIEEGVLQKTGNNNFLFREETVYKYCPIKRGIDRSKARAKHKISFDEYLAKSNWARGKFNRNMKLIQETTDLTGKELIQYVENWNKADPENKISITIIYDLKRVYEKYGAIGLIPKTGHNVQIEMKSEWLERFFDLYLCEKKLTVRQALDIIKNEELEKDKNFNELIFPGICTFRRRLNEKYTREEIKQLREPEKLEFRLSTENRKKDKSFQNVSMNYFMLVVKPKYCTERARAFLNYLKVHLIPFFKDLDFDKITPKLIASYKKQKIEDGLISNYVINEHIIFLNKLIKAANENDLLQVSSQDITFNEGIFDISKLKALLKVAKDKYPRFYPILITAITTGIPRDALLGLTWDKIDFKNNQIIVNEWNKVFIPQELCKFLKDWKAKCPKTKGNYLFPSVYGNNWDKREVVRANFKPALKEIGIEDMQFCQLQDVYAAYLLRQNVPLTFLQDQFGDATLDLTYSKYAAFIPKFSIDSVDFKPIFEE